MNRRSFFAFLGAAPLAAALGLKPRLPTATAAMAPYLEARERRHRYFKKREQTLVVHPENYDDAKKMMTTQRMAEIVSESTQKAFGDAWK